MILAARVNAAPSQAAGERLITVHENGNDRGILTRATTLREAFAEQGISFDKNDTVEPGLDETLVANNYEVNIYRARPVTIIDGAIRHRVMSPYQTPKQIVTNAGMVLHDEDNTTMNVSTDMVGKGAGLELTIDRATAFTLVLYGKRAEAYTQDVTVAEMMKAKGIRLAADDTLSVASSAVITQNMVIEIWRNGKQMVTEEQPVPFETERIQDADREVGFREVRTPGQNGKKNVSYEIEMRNGVEVGRIETQSVVTMQPQKQVEVVGAKATNTFSGDFAGALAKLRACESGGNYANKRNPLYRGAYQYSYSTWANKYGIYDPADATPGQQDQAAWETYQRRGWQPWPHCGSSLPDSYR